VQVTIFGGDTRQCYGRIPTSQRATMPPLHPEDGGSMA